MTREGLADLLVLELVELADDLGEGASVGQLLVDALGVRELIRIDQPFGHEQLRHRASCFAHRTHSHLPCLPTSDPIPIGATRVGRDRAFSRGELAGRPESAGTDPPLGAEDRTVGVAGHARA